MFKISRKYLKGLQSFLSDTISDRKTDGLIKGHIRENILSPQDVARHRFISITTKLTKEIKLEMDSSELLLRKNVF